MKVDWIVVGAGFTGATLAERIATQLGQRVLVVERRDHIGGNAYDEYDEHGVLIHRYGPHVLRTNDVRVWSYLSRFTAWRPYYHRVLAVVDGIKVPIPFNLNSLDALFPPHYARRLSSLLIAEYGFGGEVSIVNLLNSPNPELRKFARFVYERVFYGYTKKQWGVEPESLDPEVLGRVPIRVSRDNRYFRAKYQAIPAEGYTVLIRRMLRHRNIRVLLGVDYRELGHEVCAKGVVFTGPIDEFFNYVHGPLPYRSLHFEFVYITEERYQEVATVNYPNDFDFTRVTEPKHMTGQCHPHTVLIYEYPKPYEPGLNEPYYPIPQPENYRRYELYRKEAAEVGKRVIFAGRLGEYNYCSMDQAVARALILFEEVITRI